MRSFRREGDSSVSCPDKNLTDPGHRALKRISVIDTHTGGEPTRVVIGGGPDLGNGSMAERLAVFRDRHDTFRSAVVNEPRGSDVMVGALILRAGRSGVRGRGDLFQQRRLSRHVRARHHRRRRRAGAPGTASAPGTHRLETPVGTGRRHARRARYASRSTMSRATGRPGMSRSTCPGCGTYVGDVAWGGNWFFLVHDHGETLERRQRRTAHRRDLANPPGARTPAESPAADGGEIDHIELFGPPTATRRGQQKLRPLPRPGLRSLSLRHRHQRQDRLPGRRRQARRRGRSGGKRASSAACSKAWAARSTRAGPAADPRHGLRECGVDLDRRPADPFAMGIRP